MRRIVTAVVLAVMVFSAGAGAVEAPKLEVVATTMTQIVLQWTDVSPEAESIELERATDRLFTTNLKTYQVDTRMPVFADTDRDIISKKRFVGNIRYTEETVLRPGTKYYYRLRVPGPEEKAILSNIVSAEVSKPVRGIEGDLFADVVLGDSSFGENSAGTPTRHGVSRCGGVIIDRTHKPERMYIAGCNNNRILGFKTTSPKDGADIVLGQPGFSSGAGNGDSCFQIYPYRGSASASTLCLTNPQQISMAETVASLKMALDSDGNLYVPDLFNNRVLKYSDPFGTDTIADQVWGQAGFEGNEPNRGGAVSAGSLSFHMYKSGAVDFDDHGNMWVADSGNHRVLRFPKDKETGRIASEADVALGQKSLTEAHVAGYERGLDQLWVPMDIEFDTTGRMYVCDGMWGRSDGRILVFEPPFKTGMAATEKYPVPMELELNKKPELEGNTLVRCMKLDSSGKRMWVMKSSNTIELIDLKDHTSVSSVMYPAAFVIDLDNAGNLYVASKWYGLLRFSAAQLEKGGTISEKEVETVFPSGNRLGADSTRMITAITTVGDQLLIADYGRVLIYNDLDVRKLRNGRPADDVYGQKDFDSNDNPNVFWGLEPDSQGRLWVYVAEGHTYILRAFKPPLKNNSQPVKEILIKRGKEEVLPVLGGGSTSIGWAEDFAVQGPGDKIWVADRSNNRVLRIANIDGNEASGKPPYVDIVLGQQDITGNKMNGEGFGPQTLAVPYNVGISARGKLMISDNGLECGTNNRILIYDLKRFPDRPKTVLFNKDIGDPDGVIGTSDSLTTAGRASPDPTCSPFELGLHLSGAVVATTNPYSGQRFPLVYLDPSITTQPQCALGDFLSYPISCHIDKNGNVYIGDFDWYRVLVYWDPFMRITWDGKEE